ncbi:MAG: cobaltochelatase subunit CobN [Methanobacterium sp. PtaB.Bin024]|nr:MAG: cobaltochelatase subunit CobN [Methanobacterium sp. PtaB.Bin024]
MILLVTTIVFALLLCGAASAQDPDGGVDTGQQKSNSTDNLEETTTNTTDNQGTDQDPRIYGVVKEIYNESSGTYTNLTDAIPVSGATVTIKDPTDDSVIATGITNQNGEYDISFLSSLTQFNVEIAYSTYKTYLENVTPIGTPIPEYQLNYTFMPDIALLFSDSEKAAAIESLNNRRLICIDMWYGTSDNDWILQYVNFAFIYMAMPGSGWGDTWYDELLQSPANANYMISSTFGYPCDTDTDSYGGDGLHLVGGSGTDDTENTLENTYLGSYYYLATGTAIETNLQYMVEYIYYLLGDTTVDPTQNGKSPVMDTPTWGLYHPDYPTETLSAVPTQEQIKTWIESNPGYTSPYYSLKWMDEDYSNWSETSRNTVYREVENWYNTYKADITGAFIVIVSYTAGGETIDALIREYESQGRAVLNLFQSETTPSAASLLEELVVGVDANGPLERGVSAVTSLYSWSLDYNDLATGDGALTELESIDLEIIKAIQLYEENSLTSELGAQSEWVYAVTYPYFEGVYSPVVISYTDENGAEHPIESGIEKVVTLTNMWAQLKELPNFEKKIAIILYNYPPGKSELSASYLDVFQSVHDLLVKLSEESYDLGTDEIPTVDELYTLVAEFGNKGSWAQNLLDQYVEENLETLQINGQLVDAETYMTWFNELPETLQQEVIAEWGSAIGDIMVYDGYLVIPGIMLGNVFITVQPSRGWEEVEDYHSSYLPPSHQYIAFYNWLEDVFGANAMIHMGTHGTLEFLPGRTVGLQEDDWTFQLTNIPNINPYIVSNPGEGMVAKNRADALIIDHMTPAMVSSNLYGDLVVIHNLIEQYENAVTLANYQILPALQEEITAKAEEMGFEAQTEEQTFDEWMEELHLLLHEIENDVIPLGLHSLGEVLTGDELVQEVFTISSSMTQITNHMKNVLYPEITLDYYDMQKDTQYEDELNAIDAQILNYIEQIANGTDPADLGVTDADLLDDLEYCQEVIEGIRDNQEWENLLTALSGGFVTSGLGADPSYADVLPTGMNFYSSDPEKMPTQAAWETAKELVDQMLIEYYQEHGNFPETIGLVMWGTELLRTDGIAIAEFLYLLGVQIVWEDNGDVNPTPVLIPLEDLTITIDGVTIQRPRIDVFTTAVIGNEIWIDLMNNAVLLVSKANETSDENYLIKHLAEDSSLDRIFGLDGLVLEGTGVSDLVPSTSKWETSDELASVYLSRISYAWTSTDNGVIIEQNLATFQYLLKTVDIITQNIDSTWRLLDTDDYYDWYGGMLLASQSLGGNPEGLLADIRNQNDIKIRDVQDEIELEIRSQLLNPTYMDSLFDTASGWMEYASRYENLFGMQATTGCVSNEMWTLAAQNLLSDRFNVNSDYQAYATQSMLGWVVEASRRGMWQADAQLLSDLKDKYMQIATEYGVCCCHHTCGNLAFNQYMITGSSLSTAQLQQFAAVLQGATGELLNVGTTGSTGQTGQNGQSTGQSSSTGQTSSESSSSGSVSPGDVGASQEVSTSGEQTGTTGEGSAYEVSQAGQQSSGQSSMPIVAIVGVILLVGLVGVGYFRGNLLGFFKK